MVQAGFSGLNIATIASFLNRQVKDLALAFKMVVWLRAAHDQGRLTISDYQPAEESLQPGRRKQDGSIPWLLEERLGRPLTAKKIQQAIDQAGTSAKLAKELGKPGRSSSTSIRTLLSRLRKEEEGLAGKKKTKTKAKRKSSGVQARGNSTRAMLAKYVGGRVLNHRKAMLAVKKAGGVTKLAEKLGGQATERGVSSLLHALKVEAEGGKSKAKAKAKAVSKSAGSKTRLALEEKLGAPLTLEKLERALSDAGGPSMLASQLGGKIKANAIGIVLKQMRKQQATGKSSGRTGSASTRGLAESKLGSPLTYAVLKHAIDEAHGAENFASQLGGQASKSSVYTLLSSLKKAKGSDQAASSTGSGRPNIGDVTLPDS
ncbi:hypothetical protein ACFL04_02850 [Patescibacteria group bacterium]